ncbi:MAG TPA: hypothetical protein VM639_06150 [Dongiaceae bacterium]|nr:hypothetical protein [Dongiaceae bacterium]
MASGIPTDDSLPTNGPAQLDDGASQIAGQTVTLNIDDDQWRHANRLLERRYLELGRTQIDEMCLDLKARLAATMSVGLQRRLKEEETAPSPDLNSPSAERQIETAAAMAAKLLSDISWVLPWEQARSLVEPYAKGSWLLAQIQANEEQRVISVFAGELVRQTSAYMRELIFRFYDADALEQSAGLVPPVAPVPDQTSDD